MKCKNCGQDFPHIRALSIHKKECTVVALDEEESAEEIHGLGEVDSINHSGSSSLDSLIAHPVLNDETAHLQTPGNSLFVLTDLQQVLDSAKAEIEVARKEGYEAGVKAGMQHSESRWCVPPTASGRHLLPLDTVSDYAQSLLKPLGECELSVTFRVRLTNQGISIIDVERVGR